MPRRIPKLIHNRLFLVGAACVAIFWIIASAAPVQTILEVTNSTLLAVSVAVAVTYFITAYECLTADDQKLNKLSFICLGIFLSWGAMSLWRVLSLIWLLAGQPRELVQNDVIGFLQFLIICGGVLHLTAPAAMQGMVPKRRWIGVGVVAGLGVMGGLVLVSYRPDLRWLSDAILPYLPR